MISDQKLDELAKHVRGLAKRSVCKRRGVACLIFNDVSFDLIGWGVNGPPNFEPDRCSGIKDGCGCVHSEINTLLLSHPTKNELRNRLGHMLASRAPCVPCASAIINAGYISHVTVLDKSEPGDAGIKLLQECGIEVRWHSDGCDEQALRGTAIVEEGPTVSPCPGCGLSITKQTITCPFCGHQR